MSKEWKRAFVAVDSSAPQLIMMTVWTPIRGASGYSTTGLSREFPATH